MVTSKEMPIYHPSSQDELSASSAQNRIGQSNQTDNSSVMDDTGAYEKLPDSVVPKFDYLDKFQSADARRDRDQDQQEQGGFNGANDGRKKRKRVSKDEAADYYRATPRTLSAGLFPVIDKMASLVAAETDTELEELELSLDDAFQQWNDSLNSKKTGHTKRKPPAKSPIKTSYLRSAFQTPRSPHAWKSDPKEPAILTYGPFKNPNNHIVANLYKYQNATVEAKA